MRLLSWKTAALFSAGLILVRGWTRPRYDFRYETVLITGGSRGLERARADLAPERVFTQVCDVTVPPDVAAFPVALRAELGPVDVLVNNAGVIEVGPARPMNLEDFEQAMQTHFYTPLRFILALQDELRKRRGRIINIGSVGGKLPVPHLLPYDASKFARVGLSEGLPVELQKSGVTETTVCPSLMRTGSHGRGWFKGKASTESGWFTVSGSIPYLTIASAAGAKQLVEARRVGKPELIITGRARLASRVHGLAPNLSLRLLSLVNAVLPDAEGSRTFRPVEGRTLDMPWTRSILTLLTRRAARKNREA